MTSNVEHAAEDEQYTVRSQATRRTLASRREILRTGWLILQQTVHRVASGGVVEPESGTKTKVTHNHKCLDQSVGFKHSESADGSPIRVRVTYQRNYRIPPKSLLRPSKWKGKGRIIRRTGHASPP